MSRAGNTNRDDAYRDYIRSQPCVVGLECFGGTEFCHVKHAGMGGCNVPDHGNAWPGCRKHHQQSHNWGVETFQRKYGIDLCDIARKLERNYKCR